MPAHAPSVRALRALRAQLVPGVRCRECVSRSRFVSVASPSTKRARPLSTLAPVTAVHAAPGIPPLYHRLHGALKELENTADAYINRSQLRLAVRGLEGPEATVRVGVLDLQRPSATRLVRVLLADALRPEQEWEAALKKLEGDKAVLIKYGDPKVDTRSPLHNTVSIPSTFLQNHRLEILVASEDATSLSEWDRLLNIDLAPFNGRHARQIFPVHRTIVVGHGLAGVQTVGQLMANRSTTGDLISGTVDGPWHSAASESTLPDLPLVNTVQAEAAIDAFRRSLDNASTYEHGWRDSNVATALAVLSRGTTSDTAGLKPILRSHIEFVLHSAETALRDEEAAQLAALTATTDPAAHAELLRAVAAWAEFAHTELRDELDQALHSRTWRKIAWWKLPWRVDDIGLVLSDVLQRSYLVNAERYLLWVGGYFRAAGLHLADHLGADAPNAISSRSTEEQTFGSLPTGEDVFRLVQAEVSAGTTRPSPAATTLDADEAAVVPAPLDPASVWPQQIARSRNRLLLMIQPLQLRAQGIVLRTLSTTGLAAAVGALAYVNVSDTSASSAGAIAAFGTVWAWGAAQTDWNRATTRWVQEVRDEGKRVLEGCERRGRALVAEDVQRQERAMSEGDGGAERRAARDAIAAAREALAQTPGETTTP